MASIFLPLLGTLGFLLAFIFHFATKSPDNALKVARMFNKLDDQTSFNKNHNQFLKGIYEPVANEHSNVPMDVIEGSLPMDFSGAFLRIGPNPISTHLERGYHWFDGHGMVHVIRIKDGSAFYSNQWVETTSYKLARKHDQTIFTRLGEITGIVGLFKVSIIGPLLVKVFGLKSNMYAGEANTAFVMYNNRLLACYEASLPFEIQLNDDNPFRSIGFESFNETLDFPFTAHSKVDPVDGAMYFNGYSVDPTQPAYKYGKVVNEEVKSYFPIPSSRRSFSHDMMITENYVLLFESSADYDITRIVSGDLFRLNSDNEFRIGVISKHATNTNEVRWFGFKRAFAIIHALNAWEEDGEIVLHAPLGTDFNGLDAKNGTISDKYYMTELRINLNEDKTSIAPYSGDEAVEFPNVHAAFLGRKSKFGFTGEFAGNNKFIFKNIVKFNMIQRRVAAKIALPSGWLAGEPVLIPKTKHNSGEPSDSDGSDAVYIACIAYNEEEQASQWFLYDGETMAEAPMARLAAKDVRVPMGYHGLFLNEQQLQAHIHRK